MQIFSTVAGTQQALDKCQLMGLSFSQVPDTAHMISNLRHSPSFMLEETGAKGGGGFARSGPFYFLYRRQIQHFCMRSPVCSKHITNINTGQ